MREIKKIIPILSILLAILCQKVMPDSPLHPVSDKPYFTYLLVIGLIVYIIFYVLTFFMTTLDNILEYKAPFIAGIVMVVNVINIITLKKALLPVLFFPSLDRIFGVFVIDRELLGKCIFYSLKLLLTGYVFGAVLGFTTGILLGFSKTVGYWITPITRVIGPIPSTAWSPLILSLFATSYSASVFLIGLSVWFPITLMTSSGIQNVKNSYFEVSATLGGKWFYRIFKVGVPASMPNIFLGVFYATCSSFMALVTAEMVGAKYGIGWYINWQKGMMLYPNVYAGLILIAGMCTLIITVLFKFKDRILVWQKGVIKW